jgi:hypothetical protein
VLCLVDDVQWMDGASVDAMVFAARRLGAERVAFLFAARDEPRRVSLPGLADLRLGGLDRPAAGQLLAGSLADLAAAERAGLLRVTPTGISFSHPLVRAAARAGSDVATRMAAHRALADVLEGDRRAWHLAALAVGPDDQVAAELDAVAQRASDRGSPAAMSAAYEQAATLSADPGARARRLTLAAESATDAGLLTRAGALARQAGPLVTDQLPVHHRRTARRRHLRQLASHGQGRPGRHCAPHHRRRRHNGRPPGQRRGDPYREG